MRSSLGPILLGFLILYSGTALAQTDTGTGDTGVPTQSGPKPAFTYPDATPSLDFLNGALENSSITLGISGGVSYLNYGYNTINGTQDRWLYNVTPSIRIQQFRPKLAWNAGYSGGLQYYTQPGNGRSSGNSTYFYQSANGGFLWQMSPHWQMRGNTDFTHSANPFDSYLTIVGTPTQNNPNPVTYFPLTTFTQSRSFLTLSNRLTKVDTLTFTGTQNYRSTSTYNLLTSVPFYNLTSYGGQASYAHRFSPRLELGAGYLYNSLDFGSGQQRSGIQTIEMTVDYLLRPNMSISGWIGPEYTSTKTVLFIPILGQSITEHSSLWSTSVGANFGWQGIRNSFRASFSRRVLDGGGITATSQVNILRADYHRRLTSKMDLTAGAGYSHIVSITATRRSFDSGTFNTSLDYKLARSLVATVRYTYIRINQSNAFLNGVSNSNNNLVGVTISYSWSHPLGR